jgi:hypothetical protein
VRIADLGAEWSDGVMERWSSGVVKGPIREGDLSSSNARTL